MICFACCDVYRIIQTAYVADCFIHTDHIGRNIRQCSFIKLCSRVFDFGIFRHCEAECTAGGQADRIGQYYFLKTGSHPVRAFYHHLVVIPADDFEICSGQIYGGLCSSVPEKISGQCDREVSTVQSCRIYNRQHRIGVYRVIEYAAGSAVTCQRIFRSDTSLQGCRKKGGILAVYLFAFIENHSHTGCKRRRHGCSVHEPEGCLIVPIGRGTDTNIINVNIFPGHQ